MPWSIPSGGSDHASKVDDRDPWSIDATGCPEVDEFEAALAELDQKPQHGEYSPADPQQAESRDPMSVGEQARAQAQPPNRSRSRSRSRHRSRSASRSHTSNMVDTNRADRCLRPRSVTVPQLLPGTEWWAMPMFRAAESHIAKMPESPTRKVTLHSFCAGIATEACVAKVAKHPLTTAFEDSVFLSQTQ